MRGGDGPQQVEGGGSPTQEDNNRAVFVVTERARSDRQLKELQIGKFEAKLPAWDREFEVEASAADEAPHRISALT